MAMFVPLTFDTSDMISSMDKTYFGIPRMTSRRHPYMQHRCYDQNVFSDQLARIFGDTEKKNGLKSNCKQTFEMEVSAKGYKPNEIHVEVKPETRLVKVSGKHEDKDNEGAVIGIRTFCRSFTIPNSCNLEQIEPKLSEDGILKITVPKTQETIETKSTEEANVPTNKIEATSSNETKGFSTELDMSGYDPEDLNLEVTADDLVILSARHEVKSEHGGSTSQFSRSFTVDENIDLSCLKSNLSKEKVLTISAPKKQKALHQKVTIPIAMELE